jgi:hypothetical protein
MTYPDPVLSKTGKVREAPQKQTSELPYGRTPDPTVGKPLDLKTMLGPYWPHLRKTS